MASLRLVAVCFLALVASSLVESCPTKHHKKCHKRRQCPDTTIGTYFDGICITIDSDFGYIQNLIDLIKCKSDVPEYASIMELWAELQGYRTGFDTCFDTCQNDIYERICRYRNNLSPLSIGYTERIVVTRKLARRQLRPDLFKFRRCYNQLVPLIEALCGQYNIDYQPRAISCPRPLDYNWGAYFPKSKYVDDLTNIYRTCWSDYLYIVDFIEKTNWPDNCDIKRRCKDRLLNGWLDFIKQARCLETDYYPRLLDCGDNIDNLDILYLEYLKKLKCHSFDYGNIFYDIWGEIDEYCNKNNLPWVGFLDFDTRHPQYNQRGLYLLSPRLNEYFSNKFVTCRSDFMTELRIWEELNCKNGSPEWNRREEMMRELKRRLIELERCLNRYIRNILNRLNKCKRNWDIDFDNEYASIIAEIIDGCDKEIFPYIIDFRECFYNNDNYLDEIINARGIVDVTRNIIPCNTYGYDITTYIPDRELCDLIRWLENCLRNNYYPSITDLIQLQFDNQDCDEYRLRKKCLADLECIWKDYRKIIKELLCEIIDLLRKKKLVIGSDNYISEFERVRGCYRPRFDDIVGRFKGCFGEIDGALDILYKKKNQCGCKRGYKFIEASFSFSIKSC